MGWILGGTASGLAATTFLSTPTAVADIPPAVRDGDLLIAYFCPRTSSGGTPQWGVPSGWSVMIAQSRFVSNTLVGLFYKVWRTGDPMTVTSTVSGAGSMSSPGAIVFVVRSDTDGASLVLGWPPSAGFASFGEASATGGTWVPQFKVDNSVYDLRLGFFHNSFTNSINVSSPAVTPSTANPFGVRFQPLAGFSQGTQSYMNVYYSIWSDPTGTDAGTTAWTIGGGSELVVVACVSDGTSQNGLAAVADESAPVAEALIDLEAVGLEEIVTLTQAGGGGGISVF